MSKYGYCKYCKEPLNKDKTYCNIQCYNNSKRKTTEQFKAEVRDLVGDEYLILGKYVNKETGIKIKHNICDYTWEVRPGNFLQGSRCPLCDGSIKKTTEEFKKEVEELSNGEYSLIGEYLNNKTKTELIHNKCGTVFKIKPNHFTVRKSGCPNCSPNKRVSAEEYKRRVEVMGLGEYELIGKYVNTTTKVLMRHKKCGNQYKVTPNDFQTGYRCPKCFGTPRKTTEEFALEVKDLSNGEYSLIGKYNRGSEKVKILHKGCGGLYFVLPGNFLAGHRCPYCKLSRGEEEVRVALDNLGLSYEREYLFDDCRNEMPLLFDFALVIDNEVVALIEYQGEQHYNPIDFFGGVDKFEKQQKNDNIKREYCNTKDILLIEIPYWTKDVMKLIRGKLSGINRNIQLSIL